MQFLYPYFLWALALLAIPLIIHLFHFKRFKKVYFTNVHLLKELKEQTTTRSRLKSILVMLSRMAALAFLVFAFAQPFLSDHTMQSSANLVAIILDNSQSMNAKLDEVNLLLRAKDRATDIVEAYDDQDQFLLLTQDLSTKHQRLVDKKTILDFIQEVEITPQVQPLDKMIAVAQRISQSPSTPKLLYVISDFQQSITAEMDALTIDTSWQKRLIPLQANQNNNIAISSAIFEAPVPTLHEDNKLVVGITNYGDRDVQVPLSMRLDGDTRPQGVVRVDAGQTSYDTINLKLSTTGWHQLQLRIEDYPIQFDDEWNMSFEIADQISVLEIYDNQASSYLKSAFSSIPQMAYQSEAQNQLRYEKFAEQDLIILAEVEKISSGLIVELKKYVAQGGNVTIFPSPSVDLPSFNNLLQQLGVDRFSEWKKVPTEVQRINTDEYLFSGVFNTRRKNIRLPKVQEYIPLQVRSTSRRDPIMTLRNGNDFLVKYIVDQGQVYLATSPLDDDYNNLAVNAEVFIPMLYKMSIAKAQAAPMAYTAGADHIIPIRIGENTLAEELKVTGQNTEFIPRYIQTQNTHSIQVNDQINHAGMYALTVGQDTIEQLAFNYNRTESDLALADVDVVADAFGLNTKILGNEALANLSQYIQVEQKGVSLWRWCLTLALLFLLIETLLLRFWK